MIDIHSLLELDVLETKVSPTEYMDAVTKAVSDPRLPSRKPYGDPRNIERANMVLRFVVENLKEIVSSKSR